jgi:hypothetical protein
MKARFFTTSLLCFVMAPVGSSLQDRAVSGNDRYDASITTTMNGECFSIQSVGIGNADGRDGSLHYFRIGDVRKERGTRNVSLFVSGTAKATIPNFDKLLDVAIINTFRQAFDNGAFSFEQPFSTTTFFELPLKPSAFEPSKTATDAQIRRFIEFGVYYLAYKFAERPNPFVDFSGTDDLSEYQQVFRFHSQFGTYLLAVHVIARKLSVVAPRLWGIACPSGLRLLVEARHQCR